MRPIAIRLVAISLCLLISSVAARAQMDDRGWVNGVGEPWRFDSNRYTAEQAETARARWQQLETELGPARGDWAGVYQIGGVADVRMKVLRWSAGQGFVSFNVNACTANVDDLDYGEVVADSPSYIDIISRRNPQSQNKRKLVKVKWGERRYLIEDYAVGYFCDYVAGLGEYNGPRELPFEEEFFSRHDDRGKPPATLPTVPPEYREFVRRPIDATITKVGKSYLEVNPDNEWWNDLVTPVTINAGSNQRIKRGLKLQILDSDEHGEEVEITRVGTNHAQGIIVRQTRKRPGAQLNEWDDGKDDPKPTISIGWKLTTSLHKQLLRADEQQAAWEAKQNRR